MGCTCSEPCYAMGNVTYILERIASCCAMTAIMTCIVITLMVMLGVGIGLGYNYCFVDTKLASYPTTTFPPFRRVLEEVKGYDVNFRADDEEFKYSAGTSKGPLNPTMIVPLNKEDDISLLLSKIREYKKNVTLELVA